MTLKTNADPQEPKNPQEPNDGQPTAPSSGAPSDPQNPPTPESKEPQNPQEPKNTEELNQLRSQNEEALKRAQTAEESLAQARTELAAVRMESARLRIRTAYPQISDNALDTLAPKDTDPSKLEDWAKAYAAELDKIQPAQPQPEPPQRTPGNISNTIRNNGMPHPQTGRVQGTAESGYEYGCKFAAINDK